MIRRLTMAATALWATAGCVQTAATPMETVQVRGATIGCSEAITQLGDEPGVDLLVGGIGGNAATGLRVSGGVGGVSPASPVQRCQRVLDTVSRIAEAELTKVHLENQKLALEVAREQLELDMEKRAMEASEAGLDTAW